MKTLLSLFVFFSFCSVNAQNSQDTLSIYFDFNKSTISSASSEDLMEFNASEHMTIISVVAHCDTSGSQAYNLKLAQKRLDAVLLKIDSTATTTIAQGEKISSKAKNYDAQFYRRVDIIYSDKSKEPLSLTESVVEFIESKDVKLNIDLKILFYPGEARLLPECFSEVQEFLSIMKKNPNLEVHIHGHVCCGPNYILSKNRAHGIYMYLLENRINAKRMKYTGHSNTQPRKWPENTVENRDANRRVSLEFTKK
ncbi:OmpA family protein [Crocinitomicaceae bacterium]|nr:OmpA family protein [Crocinitomicaceae bacterium]